MIGDQIRHFRKMLGINQMQLAKRLHVTQGTISQWENGLTEPSVEMIARLADVLGTTANDLIGELPTVVSATLREAADLDDEEKILIANYRKALPEYQAVAQQILGNPENQRREKISSSAG